MAQRSTGTSLKFAAVALPSRNSTAPPNSEDRLQATPLSTCCSAPLGFTTKPASITAIRRSTRIRPVGPGSTVTSAT